MVLLKSVIVAAQATRHLNAPQSINLRPAHVQHFPTKNLSLRLQGDINIMFTFVLLLIIISAETKLDLHMEIVNCKFGCI